MIDINARGKLARLMALTTSDRDGEALAALRKANAMLVKAGLPWAEIIERLPATAQNHATAEQRRRRVAELYDALNGRHSSFYADIQRADLIILRFCAGGEMSDADIAALEQCLARSHAGMAPPGQSTLVWPRRQSASPPEWP